MSAVPNLSRPLPPMPVAVMGKVGCCCFGHPVAAVRTVNLSGGCVVVAAGAGVVSAGLVASLLRPQPHVSTEAAESMRTGGLPGDAESVVVTSGVVTCMALALLPGGGAA
ncbi:hypothetical protein DQ04_16061000, partial [Trypanosoma grayi]|uniref:hypothetical protein n=1 Tax=Trypanosoma grayi TaxID=71804 RepID=UPI0004F42AF8